MRDRPYDAVMDPWCIVPVIGGERLLFGFAIRHPTSGGLSWLRSTAIWTIDTVMGWATTASGREYKLGRQFEPADIPHEGEEAWLALKFLVGPEVEDQDAIPRISHDPVWDVQWVIACKAARHLRLAPPCRVPAEIEAFIARHYGDYVRHREMGTLH